MPKATNQIEHRLLRPESHLSYCGTADNYTLQAEAKKLLCRDDIQQSATLGI